MDINDCIKFTNENPVCFLATVDGDQPHVRALSFWFADETGFYFQTGNVKLFYHELKKNPKMEVCFYRHEGMAGPMLRVSGKVEFLDEIKLRKKVMSDRPFLKDFGLTIESPGLIIFRIAHGSAHFWSLGNNMKPKEIISF